jgi:hypothetical protein
LVEAQLVEELEVERDSLLGQLAERRPPSLGGLPRLLQEA